MNLHISTGEQLTVVVGNVHFRQQGPGSWIDRSGRANYLPREGLARKFTKVQIRGDPDGSILGHALWYIDVHPKRLYPGHDEKRVTGTCVNHRAKVGVSGGNNS